MNAIADASQNRYPTARAVVRRERPDVPHRGASGGPLIIPQLLLVLSLTGCDRDAVSGVTPREDYGPAGTRAYQEGTMLYLERVDAGRKMRVGLQERWGGSIVEVSLDGTNFVNAFDAGREVQLSLYDGAHRYDNCAGCKGIWGWNPVQGGDVHTSGSTVLEKRVDAEALYIKVRPNHWYPGNKGGGHGRPVPADIVVEQWVSSIPDHPTVFKLTYRITHEGNDAHAFTTQQEFPAIYVNREFDRFVHYSGARPWTDDQATTSALPKLFAEPQLRVHTSEWWGAFVNRDGVGLTIFTPGSFPYMSSGVQPGSPGPKGSGAVYTHPFTPFAIGPGAVIEGDIYLLVGDYRNARQIIYQLVERVRVNDVAAPIGALDSAFGVKAVSGTVDVDGWAYDNAAVAAVEVLVNGQPAGQASRGYFKPDVKKAWPGAPSTAGFRYRLDTAGYADGAHVITVRLSDSAGNKNELTGTLIIGNRSASLDRQ